MGVGPVVSRVRLVWAERVPGWLAVFGKDAAFVKEVVVLGTSPKVVSEEAP